MFKLVLLASLVAVVFGGRSPNADYVDQLASAPGARYSTCVIEDAKLDVPGLVAKYGYPIESHGVMTEDGYALTMHRIPHGRDRNNHPSANKPIVFLMHGLLSSSADYLILGPKNSLGYILAEEGYDVWMGNARGNFYSRAHRRLNPDSRLSQNFWKFSWDEIGNHDLPAFLNYIERVTGQSKLHYIGHSQGGTAFVVLNSLRPEYNKKFISFQGLAPATFFTYNEHPTFTALAPYGDIIETAAFSMGLGEVFGNREFITWMATTFCNEGATFQSVCDSMLFSGTSDYFNETMVPALLGHAPAGASIRQFGHYGQVIKSHKFRRYNHNLLTNLATYGSATPPEYDMSLVTAPAYIHYADNDLLVHPKDAEDLARKLGNLVELHKVDSPVFDHLDFIWGKGPVRERLYNKVLTFMKQAERKFKD